MLAVFRLFAHRSMMLKDIPFLFAEKFFTTKRKMGTNKKQHTNEFVKLYFNRIFLIGHLDTPGWNARIACLKLMHQISYISLFFGSFTRWKSIFMCLCVCHSVWCCRSTFIFEILKSLHFDKLTLSVKYCLFLNPHHCLPASQKAATFPSQSTCSTVITHAMTVCDQSIHCFIL